jgi:hypothetical protein
VDDDDATPRPSAGRRSTSHRFAERSEAAIRRLISLMRSAAGAAWISDDPVAFWYSTCACEGGRRPDQLAGSMDRARRAGGGVGSVSVPQSAGFIVPAGCTPVSARQNMMPHAHRSDW